MDVRTACLGILMTHDASGYEIKKAFKEGWFSIFFDASYGSIYPALTKLTEDGLVSCKTQAQGGRPDKKVYRITPAGEEAFSKALLEPVADDKFRSDFLATIYFAELLPPVLIRKLVEQRIAHHKARAANYEALDCGDKEGAELFLARYARTFNETAARFLAENAHLLEQSESATAANKKSNTAEAAE